MNPRVLLDTHVIVRWLVDERRLSKEQKRSLSDASRRGEPVAVSAVSLLEIAVLLSSDSPGFKGSIQEIFEVLETNPVFRILPLTVQVATEVFALGGSLRDPADRAVVATARVHRLKLMTSDQRIIDSGLVPVVD